MDDWTNWCRLCGSCNSVLKFENTTNLQGTMKRLGYHFWNDDFWKICNECLTFITEVQLFTIKCDNAQKMFAKLESSQMIDIQTIRREIGLDFIMMDPISEDMSIKMETVQEAEDNKYNVTIKSEENLSVEEEKSPPKNEKHKKKLKTETESENSAETMAKRNPDGRKKLIESHSDLFDYSCQLCSLVFDKFAQFQKHTLSKHKSIARAVCKVCMWECGNRKRILEHKRFHYPDKVAFECKPCKRSYILKSAYEAHLKARHSPSSKKFECTKCPNTRAFQSLAELRKHEKIHLPPELKQFYHCDLCQEKKFATKCAVKTHILSMHLQIRPVFTCEYCGKTCSSTGALKDHQLIHKPRSQECSRCLKKFKNKSALTRHYEQVHSTEKHYCSICNSSFSSRITLRRHSRVHSEDKKYKCNLCLNEYKRREALKIHLNTHSGNRPFQCPFCDRTFSDSSNRRKHKLKDHPQELAAFEAKYGKGKIEKFDENS